jgi:hypothetical protein
MKKKKYFYCLNSNPLAIQWKSAGYCIRNSARFDGVEKDAEEIVIASDSERNEPRITEAYGENGLNVPLIRILTTPKGPCPVSEIPADEPKLIEKPIEIEQPAVAVPPSPPLMDFAKLSRKDLIALCIAKGFDPRPTRMGTKGIIAKLEAMK